MAFSLEFGLKLKSKTKYKQKAEVTRYKMMSIVTSLKQLLFSFVQLLEDALQMHRLQYVIDGREGDMRDEHVQGMLGECCRIRHCWVVAIYLQLGYT